ncbi:MAG TPA: class I adenylate-forming enzyme family protein [Pseudonocardiaceae bacterium]
MNELAAAAASCTVQDVFDRAFQIYPDRIAVTSEDAQLTYRELGDRTRSLATALHNLGIRQGDRVAVLSETRPEYVETYAALARLGATTLALNIRLHADELAYCVQQGQPVALLASGRLAQLAEAVHDRAPSVRHWICFDGAGNGFLDYPLLLDPNGPAAPRAEVRAEHLHNVLYTSGTTGRPKGAMISHGAAAIRGLRLAQWFALTAEDGFIGWLPLYHCGGDESLYATMLTGGTYATLRRADAETMFRMIERDRLSWTLLLPGVITDFLHHPRRGEYDLSSLRFAIGYANMMPNVVAQLTASCGIDFYDAFGQTETSYLLAHGVSGPGATPTLRKIPSPLLALRLVDGEGHEVPAGTPGECVVRGPSVMSGYLDDPDATAEVFRDGWLHTGDVLVRHDDGAVSFVDRVKYLIKTGGENVYPAEVEQVIAEHPAVQEVCVFGVPDEHWGETVKAVVVRSPDGQLTADEVVAWCRDRLAGYKRPRYVQFMTAEQLPRSTTGKLQRHELAKIPVDPQEAV